MQEIGDNLATMLGGNYINWFSIQGRSYKVIPQVRRRYRVLPDQLKNYYVSTKSGDRCRSAHIGFAPQRTVEPEQLKRFQQLNSATISAVLVPGVTMGQGLDCLEAEAKKAFPKGYTADYAGRIAPIQTGRQRAAGDFLLLDPRDFSRAGRAVRELPRSADHAGERSHVDCGALIFLSLGLATVNIYTQVGLITLIGLISKHGILIVQFANERQREGMSKREAIEEAASVRLRPILMTTARHGAGGGAVAGGPGAGAVSRFDIGLVIFTGMAIGTAFTLFVVPAIYMLLAKEHHEKPLQAEASAA